MRVCGRVVVNVSVHVRAGMNTGVSAMRVRQTCVQLRCPQSLSEKKYPFLGSQHLYEGERETGRV